MYLQVDNEEERNKGRIKKEWQKGIKEKNKEHEEIGKFCDCGRSVRLNAKWNDIGTKAAVDRASINKFLWEKATEDIKIYNYYSISMK
jgi:hypothetical protein